MRETGTEKEIERQGRCRDHQASSRKLIGKTKIQRRLKDRDRKGDRHKDRNRKGSRYWERQI